MKKLLLSLMICNLATVTASFANTQNYQLKYGNDTALEQAYLHYQQTGSAPNIETDGFIKFAHNHSHQPVIKTTPFQETVVSLEPGERFTNISSGDPSRWSYAVAVSGAGAHQVQHILIKPSQASLSTNLVITTDKRLYNLKLVSLQTPEHTKHVSFWYPQEMMGQQQQLRQQVENVEVARSPHVSLNQLNFEYRYKSPWLSRIPSWRPTRVFDDGVHTYLEFPKNIAHRDLPVLFVMNGKDKALVNYRFKSPFMIVDKIFEHALLVMGNGKNQSQLFITNRHFV